MSKPTREWVENEIKVSLTALDGGTGLFTDFDEDEARIAAILRYALDAAVVIDEMNECMKGHMIGVNCKGPRMSDDAIARLDALRASQPWSDA